MSNVEELKVEQQIKVLFPLFEKYIRQFKVKLSQAVREDLTKKTWNFILNERQSTDFVSEHVIESNWKEFEKYFQHKGKIYFFYQEPIKGLAVIESKLWAFTDPKVAVSFFRRQKEKPKNFSPATTKPLPFFSLVKGFIKSSQEIITDTKKASFKINKIYTLLRMSYFFFSDDEFAAFAKIMRSLTPKTVIGEVDQLQKDIQIPSIPATTIEKRLQAVLDISREFFLKNPTDLEQKYLNKLASEKMEEREKALKFLSKYIEKNLITQKGEEDP